MRVCFFVVLLCCASLLCFFVVLLCCASFLVLFLFSVVLRCSFILRSSFVVLLVVLSCRPALSSVVFLPAVVPAIPLFCSYSVPFRGFRGFRGYLPKRPTRHSPRQSTREHI